MSPDVALGGIFAIICAAAGSVLAIVPLALFEQRRRDSEVLQMCTLLELERGAVIEICNDYRQVPLQMMTAHTPIVTPVWTAMIANTDFIGAIESAEFRAFSRAYRFAGVVETFRRRYDLFASTQGMRPDFLAQIGLFNSELSTSAGNTIAAFEEARPAVEDMYSRCLRKNRASSVLAGIVVVVAVIVLLVAGFVAASVITGTHQKAVSTDQKSTLTAPSQIQSPAAHIHVK